MDDYFDAAETGCPLHSPAIAGCASCFDALLAKIKELQHDAMTGLLRRETGLKLAERLAGRCSCMVIFIDVDDLKGHNRIALSRGDWAICLVAKAISGASRPGDLLMRWGGDELVMVGELALQNKAAPSWAQTEAALAIARRIQNEVARQSAGAVTVSWGIGMLEVGQHRGARNQLPLDLRGLVDGLAAAAENRKQAKRSAGVADHNAPVLVP